MVQQDRDKNPKHVISGRVIERHLEHQEPMQAHENDKDGNHDALQQPQDSWRNDSMSPASEFTRPVQEKTMQLSCTMLPEHQRGGMHFS